MQRVLARHGEGGGAVQGEKRSGQYASRPIYACSSPAYSHCWRSGNRLNRHCAQCDRMKTPRKHLADRRATSQNRVKTAKKALPVQISNATMRTADVREICRTA